MSPSDERYPSVPERRLEDGGWTRTDATVETVFQLPGTRVEGATLLYGDERTRRAAAEHGGLDQRWRFFFATKLTFTPSLSPGIGPAMILPTVRSEANRTFKSELRDRGFESIGRGRTERVRVASGERAKLTQFRAELPMSGLDATLPIAGWVGVWHGDGFRIGAGAYPARPVAEILETDDPPEVLTRTRQQYRDELLDLIRAIE
ncbi:MULTISPECIES: hypothetical protein [Halomicrobium]|uniref:Uncharacterized protein n=2 Tax=Halomicrobium mukohataei TaxID=57705 RepID=C7P2H6_HALMD|nr:MULTISPECIES: hypothetical protein [Halomicrobium]ACV49291.1 hypothetical protein Hmuk_3186 [Halomicrobium mukohataei DSM 12286]QCD64690.1 hypothetical protein E5139_03160 [Halomicrobium mukohataei]QFR19497.1 hypothetical protein GBQ70_03160 [Halomicrobium sp. ZPS1]